MNGFSIRIRAAGTVVTAVLLAGTAAGAVLLAPESASAQDWRTVTTSRQLAGEREVNVEVSYGAGRFQLRPVDEGTALYRMRLRYDEETFQPISEYRNGRLKLGIEGTGRRLSLRRDQSGELDVSLTRSVPMDLKLEFGAVRANLDLGGLSIRSLHLSTGASEALIEVSSPNPLRASRAKFEVGAASFTARGLGNLNAENIELAAGVGDVKLDFSGEWRNDSHVKVGMGLGSLELTFTRDIGVKIVRSTLLTSFDSQELIRRGDAYYSENWESADRRITVEVEAAFGSITVAWTGRR
jgi:hypothetical protein